MKLVSCLWLGAAALATAACSLGMSRYGSESSKPNSGLTDSGTEQPSDGIAHLVIDAGTRHQTLIGFGAAVAWYANTLASQPSDSPVFDLVFRDLGLDIIRFRDAYGRTDPNNSDSISAEATILARAKVSLGRTPKILLSSWSPPGKLKASGLENCHGSSEAGCTLASDANGFVYDQFAQYFVDSLEYYAQAGIYPDFLSIQNEPNYIPDGWEGCYFGATESTGVPGYDVALRKVRGALASIPDAPKLIGPEPISLDNGVLDTYVTDDTFGLFDGLAHHIYSGNFWRQPDNYQTEMSDALATAKDLPLFQTEFDTQGDGGKTGGFETAWVMHNSLTIENLSAFLYWGLIWAGSTTQTPGGGLVWGAYDTATKQVQFSERPQYYAMRHFARFTDPGYVRVDATSTLKDVRVSAYISPASDQLTLVLLNVGDVAHPVQLDGLTGFSAPQTQAFRSIFVSDSDAGASEYWKKLEGFDLAQPFTLPAKSVLTVVLGAGLPSSVEADAGSAEDAGSP